MDRKYAHLIKKLEPKDGPLGLYPNKIIWMESEDLEGFNAHFGYTLINEPLIFHPTNGAVVHPYDECIVIAGTYVDNILKLGAEVTLRIGDEGEEYVIKEPSVVLIPKGTPHGPFEVKMLENPIAHYCIGLNPKYSAMQLEYKKEQKTRYERGKYVRCIKPFWIGLPSPFGYADGIPLNQLRGPGNADQLVWFYGKDLEGFEVNFTWGFYSKCGIWHRAGEMHVHPEEEILVFVGLYPDNLNYLGAELEIGMGKEGERYVFNTPSVVICPKGFPHLPLITRWVDQNYAFFVVCLSAEHATSWIELD
ncbi:MAG: hypothetical protein QW707_05350 [Candidatus Bathyarchaeia archaeon]